MAVALLEVLHNREGNARRTARVHKVRLHTAIVFHEHLVVVLVENRLVHNRELGELDLSLAVLEQLAVVGRVLAGIIQQLAKGRYAVFPNLHGQKGIVLQRLFYLDHVVLDTRLDGNGITLHTLLVLLALQVHGFLGLHQRVYGPIQGQVDACFFTHAQELTRDVLVLRAIVVGHVLQHGGHLARLVANEVVDDLVDVCVGYVDLHGIGHQQELAHHLSADDLQVYVALKVAVAGARKCGDGIARHVEHPLLPHHALDVLLVGDIQWRLCQQVERGASNILLSCARRTHVNCAAAGVLESVRGAARVRPLYEALEDYVFGVGMAQIARRPDTVFHRHQNRTRANHGIGARDCRD